MFPDPPPEGIKWPYHETDVANLLTSQFLAIEGQAFVLVATQVVKTENLEALNMAGFPLFKTVRRHLSLSSIEYMLMNGTARWRILNDLWPGWSAFGEGICCR